MTDSNNAEVQKVVESAEGAVPEAADLEELAATAGTDIDLASGEDDDEDSEDSLTFSNGVIEKIVALAMR